MHLQTRRDFIKTSLVGTGLCLTGSSLTAAATGALVAHSAADRVPVGRTGIKASFLAQGTGFNGSSRSSDHTRMGQESFSRLLHHSVDQGVRFLDMADLYGTHPFVKTAIKDLKREEFVLLSKIWPRKEDWVTPSGNSGEEIDRFRRELGVDCIDICLLHCMVNDQWATEYERMRDGLSKLKEKGAVRAVGVSCHDFGALKVASTHPWVDVIFARINHKGGSEYSMDSTTDEVAKVLKTARANGKFVVGMKIFGAGKLVKPEEKDASLKYVLGNQLVDAMTIGMLKTSEIDDSVSRINTTFKSLAA